MKKQKGVYLGNNQNEDRMKIRMRILLCLALLPGVLKGSNNFEDFAKKASLLPTFRDLYSQGKISGDSYQKYSVVSFAEFEATLDEYISIVSKQLGTGQWLDAEPLAELLDPHKEKFLPFAQKIVVTPGAINMCKGDLHGDMHSLIACLKDLQEKNFIQREDILKISKPEFKLFFHGDYVDRGLWGVEVLYILMRLKMSNPDSVFLIRGNHEDPELAGVYGFYQEFHSKFSEQTEADLARCYKKISTFYNLLPVVLYLGSGTDTIKNFAQLCHGGIEIGYNPQELLVSEKEFQCITSFNRCTECSKLPSTHVVKSPLGESFSPLLSHCRDFTAITPTFPYPIGFLWYDFMVDPFAPTTLSSRGLQCNQALTHDVLKAASTKNAALRMIVRAHQHTPDNEVPLMKLLFASRGCAVLWQDIKNHACFNVEDGMVLTLLLSPDSLFGTPHLGGSTYKGFDYDTSILLKTAENFRDWTVQTINTNVYTTRFAIKN